MPQLQTDRPTCMQNKNWPWRHPRWTLFHHLWAQQCDCLLQTPGPPSPPVQPFLEPSQTLPLSCHGPGLLHHYSQKCTPKTRQKVMYKNTMVCHMIIFGGEKKRESLTWPVSLRQTVCMPPATTWTIFSGSGTRDGFFLWRTSSPWPSCPMSPWPRTRTKPASLAWLLWATITQVSFLREGIILQLQTWLQNESN